MSEIVKKSIVKQAFLALCVVLLPLTVSAAGLGKLDIFSALGEPLNAEVELLLVTPEELDSLSANLASSEQYAAQGIEKTAIQQNIQTTVSKKPNGTTVIKLTSNQAVTDPFLDILIQVVWSSGQLSREYTLLLDPADYSVDKSVNPVVDKPKPITAQSDDKQLMPSPAVAAPSASKTRKSSHVDHSQKAKATSPEGQVTTVKGDTLIEIARRLQVQDVNLDQLLLGLYKANADAFAGQNMNRLKVGQVLTIPSAETFQGISKQEAQTEVRAHVASWQSYANKLAGAVSKSVANDQSASSRNAGKIVTKDEEKAAPVAEGPRDVVSISKTEVEKPAKAGEGQAASAQNKPQQSASNLQDDLGAKQNTIKETDERSSALEKQISDMKKLLEIKNKNMANVQKNAAKNAEQNKQPTQKADASPNPFSMIDLPILLAIAGALMALLLALWLRARSKYKADLARELELANAEAEAAAANGDSASAGLHNEFSLSSSALLNTQEVDALAEAEVFLAYGRQAQAEDILKEAIQKTPERYELHLKLLEILAQSNNKSEFESVALELFSKQGSHNPIWPKVSELGRTLDAENKLYHKQAEAPSASVESASNLAVADFTDAALLDESAESIKPSEPLAFNADSNLTSASKPSFPEDVTDIEEIHFDLPERSASAPAKAKPLDMDIGAISLDFEAVPQVDSSDEVAEPIPDAFSGDFSNLLKVDVKSPQDNSPASPANHEASTDVATKLELAAAYIDMADKEGALELLTEALNEGSPQQRQRAQTLIDSLA